MEEKLEELQDKIRDLEKQNHQYKEKVTEGVVGQKSLFYIIIPV